MATMVQCTCKNSECRKRFMAREADRKRGWGQFCSKSCKAMHQTRVRASNAMAKWSPRPMTKEQMEEEAYQAGMEANEAGWDGHKNAF